MEIRDKDWRVLQSTSYRYTQFTEGSPTWVEVEIPNVEVNNEFYIHVYRVLRGCYLAAVGIDDSLINEHSTLTEIKPDGTIRERSSWPYGLPAKSKVNWMIRVVGTAMVPEQ